MAEQQVEDGIGLLEWTAQSPGGSVSDDVDSLRRARRADPGTDDPLHAHPRWLTPGAGRSRRPGPRGARYGPISAARSRISLRWVQRT